VADEARVLEDAMLLHVDERCRNRRGDDGEAKDCAHALCIGAHDLSR
jgi:hypothetical protein